MRPSARHARDDGPLSCPPPRTAAERPAVDLVHLARQTLGDRDLEVELLGLFARQAQMLTAALEAAATVAAHLPAEGADPLHVLCGSARAVGAWDVAEVAHGMERHLRESASPSRACPWLGDLRAAVDRACAAIADVLDD